MGLRRGQMVGGRGEGRREGIENCNWPAVMVTRRKLTRRPGRDGRAFPEDVDGGGIEVPTVGARAIRPSDVSQACG